MNSQNTLSLNRPAAGEVVSLSPAGAEISLSFSSSQPSFSKEGANLICSFPDGGTIVLKNFYEIYSQDNLPQFSVNGEAITGAVFLGMVGKDLLPAADAESAGGVFGGGASYSTASIGLESGVQHLGGLDLVGFDRDAHSRKPDLVRGDAMESTSYPLAAVSAPEDMPQGDSGWQPELLPQADKTLPTLRLPSDGEGGMRVSESMLPGGSANATTINGASTSGVIGVGLNGESGTVSIQGFVFVLDQNGDASLPKGGVTLHTDRGTLTITEISGGNISYTYTLDEAQDHSGSDVVTDTITIVVTDADGDTVSSDFNINILDDAPVARDDIFAVSVGDAATGAQSSGSVLDNDSFGADAPAHRTVMGVGTGEGVQNSGIGEAIVGLNGTLVMNADGTYSYIRHADATGFGDTFSYTITDADGSTSTATLTIKVNNAHNASLTEEHDASAYTSVIMGDAFGGTLTSSDGLTTADSLSAVYGVVRIAADGSILLVPDTDFVNSLTPNQTVTDSLTVHFADGTSQVVTVTIVGNNSNDDAVTIQTYGDGSNLAVNITLPALGAYEITTDGTLDLGEGEDTLHVTEGMTGGSITLGNGADSANVSGGMSNAVLDGGQGADSIQITGSVIASAIGGDAGRESLNVNGSDGDSISITGNLSGAVVIGGDIAEKMTGGTGGAGDWISITGDINTGARIGGDAGRNMFDATGGANDTIIISGSVTGTAIGGDAGLNMNDSTGGDGDSIRIDGDVTSSRIGGDAGQSITNGICGSGDIVEITGNITGTTDLRAYIGGDAGLNITDSVCGDSDTIVLTGNIVNTLIGGDAGQTASNTVCGSEDVIIINGNVVESTSIAGDAYRGQSGASGGDGDSITINGNVGGDCYIAGDFSFLRDGAEGTVAGSRDYIEINGNVGAFGNPTWISGDTCADVAAAVCGDEDTIIINGNVIDAYVGGDANNISEGSKGGDRDYILINGDVVDSGVGGDVTGYGMSNSIAGTGDSVIITGTVSGVSAIGGDAAWYRMNNSVGGDDYISIGTIAAGGEIMVGGEIGRQMEGGSSGGNDILEVGTMRSGWLGGEAGQTMMASYGGNDTITVGTLTGGLVGGEVGGNMSNSSGGNDYIVIESMTGGRVAGEAGGDMTNSTGGNDSIVINGDVTGGVVAGDVGGVMRGGTGGTDTIIVNGNVMDAAIAGDGGSSVWNEAVLGSGDSIVIHGSVTNGKIAGDAIGSLRDTVVSEKIVGVTVGGDNDIIRIDGDVTNSLVAGDTAENLNASIGGHGDSIFISGTVGDGSIVAGDCAGAMYHHSGSLDVITTTGNDYINVNSMTGNAVITGDGGSSVFYTLGDDVIKVNSMDGGTILGDAHDVHGSIVGSDAISVGTMSAGVIAGDYLVNSGNNTAKGGNIITVDTFADGGEITIDGGIGARDILSFGSGVDHVTLSGNSSAVTLSFGAGDDNSRTASVSVNNTEVFDGGAGNDILDASAMTGKVVLRGGQGSDMLTGNGNTVFHWSAADITAGATDTVNYTAGDTLLVGSGVEAVLDGNVLSLTAGGVTQTVNISGVLAAGALQSVAQGTATDANVTLSDGIDSALQMAALDVHLTPGA